MSGSVNKVILIGNMGRDPEIRNTSAGNEIVSFSLATSKSWRDKSTGERREKTEWHRIVVFNERVIKFVKEYVRKGNKVYIEGELQTRKWQGDDGVDRYTTEIVINQFRGLLELLSSKQGVEDPPPHSGDGYDAEGTTDKEEATSSLSRQEQSDRDDEIPF